MVPTFTWAAESGSISMIINMPPNVEMIYSDIGDEVISGRRLSTCTD